MSGTDSRGMRKRLLVVEDDPPTRCKLIAGLETAGFHVDAVATAPEAIAALERNASGEFNDDYALLVADLHTRNAEDGALARRMRELQPNVPVIVTTPADSVKSAIEALKSGVWDYITKPPEFEELELQARRAIRHAQLAAEVQRLRREAGKGTWPQLIGHSKVLKELSELIKRVAKSDVGVLVLGESGTGKEVVARAIHEQSSRSEGPFVAINCAALPDALLESELFGHVRGAFTDARRARRGLFLEATGGTLLLDEIGEMPIAMQPKLLRALQERVVRPVGSDEVIPFDTRVIATTNRDLVEAVSQKIFREDLYYRLNVVQIDMPALRTRGNDILELALTFVERFAERHRMPVRGLSAGAAERLLRHSWPGNVRELQNVIERGVALSRSELLQVDDLPLRLTSLDALQVTFMPEAPEDVITLAELEARYIAKIMAQFGGNKSQVARLLGVDRKTLLRKIKRDGTEPEDEPDASE